MSPSRFGLFAFAWAFAATAADAVPAPSGRASYAGLPRLVMSSAAGAGGAVQVLDNPGFFVGYSAAHRQPLWVTYRAASAHGRKLGPRPEKFEPDPRVERPVTMADYGRSRAYDRGHLAPNFLIGKLYGSAAQHATFLMSNISPQRKRLNGLVWQRLEEAEADDVAPRAGELWVAVGPVFDAEPKTMRSGIPIPAAFYRIWLDVQDDGAPRALAFLVPQEVCGTEPLSRYLTTIDAIEDRTGLDFFHELADAAEGALERSAVTAGWELQRFDTRAPRYADKFGPLQC